MATQVVMPKLSPTMEEGQLSRWLKNEGDKVSTGEPLAEIDTDKATMEAQALTTGVLRKILVSAGETVPLGAVIAIIADADEDISTLLDKIGSGAQVAENKKSIEESAKAGDGVQSELARVVPDGARTQATIEGKALDGDAGGKPTLAPQTSTGAHKEATTPQRDGGDAAGGNGQQARSATGGGDGSGDGGGRLIVSPVAARMAAEAGINLQSLTGSGPGGRIIKRDIEEAISAGTTPAVSSDPSARYGDAPAGATTSQQTSQPLPAPATPSTVEGASPYRDEPITTMRATIARRLVTSLGPIPHFFLTTEIEMDRAADMRRQINELEPELKASINDLIIKVAAVALTQHPQVNASFQNQAIRHYERADIGVAVAIEDGLITPVIRSADRKSIGQISREVRELAERARSRKLKPEEYTGATFSISNLGMFGIDDFTAVINPPEAAILAVGAARPQPVAHDGEIVVRQIMRVTMSCDHRVIDGASGAKFLQTFKKLLENPLLLMV